MMNSNTRIVCQYMLISTLIGICAIVTLSAYAMSNGINGILAKSAFGFIGAIATAPIAYVLGKRRHYE